MAGNRANRFSIRKDCEIAEFLYQCHRTKKNKIFLADVDIICQNGLIIVHSIVLMAGSTLLREYIRGLSPSEREHIVIHLPDYDAQDVAVAISCFYTGRCILSQYNKAKIYDILTQLGVSGCNFYQSVATPEDLLRHKCYIHRYLTDDDDSDEQSDQPFPPSTDDGSIDNNKNDGDDTKFHPVLLPRHKSKSDDAGRTLVVDEEQKVTTTTTTVTTTETTTISNNRLMNPCSSVNDQEQATDQNIRRINGEAIKRTARRRHCPKTRCVKKSGSSSSSQCSSSSTGPRRVSKRKINFTTTHRESSPEFLPTKTRVVASSSRPNLRIRDTRRPRRTCAMKKYELLDKESEDELNSDARKLCCPLCSEVCLSKRDFEWHIDVSDCRKLVSSKCRIMSRDCHNCKKRFPLMMGLLEFIIHVLNCNRSQGEENNYKDDSATTADNGMKLAKSSVDSNNDDDDHKMKEDIRNRKPVVVVNRLSDKEYKKYFKKYQKLQRPSRPVAVGSVDPHVLANNNKDIIYITLSSDGEEEKDYDKFNQEVLVVEPAVSIATHHTPATLNTSSTSGEQTYFSTVCGDIILNGINFKIIQRPISSVPHPSAPFTVIGSPRPTSGTNPGPSSSSRHQKNSSQLKIISHSHTQSSPNTKKLKPTT